MAVVWDATSSYLADWRKFECLIRAEVTGCRDAYETEYGGSLRLRAKMCEILEMVMKCAE